MIGGSMKITLTEDQIKQASDAYRDGLSLFKISKYFGISRNTLKKRLVEAGILIRSEKRIVQNQGLRSGASAMKRRLVKSDIEKNKLQGRRIAEKKS